MRTSLPILALMAAIALTTEATGPAAIINLKSQLGNLALNAATSVIQAKQNLLKSTTSAIINAKTSFLQRQLPRVVQFKLNPINSVLELKKNLLKSKAAIIGQLIGGNAIQPAVQYASPYRPPAAPPAPIDSSYSPQPPLEPLPPVPNEELPVQADVLSAPADVPFLPYPPPVKRQQRLVNAHAPTSYNSQQAPLYESQYNKI